MPDFKSLRTWSYLLAAGLIDWILVHVLNLFQIGAVSLWGKAISVITLGSSTVRDLPYAMAALNPYPISSLLFLIGMTITVACSPIYVLIFMVSWRMGAKREQRRREAEKLEDRAKRSLARRIISLTRSWALIAFMQVVMIICALIPIGVLNQAVLCRRLYEADRDIVAPYLTTEQLTQVQAEFCGIYTKTQYTVLLDRLNSIASAHNVKLRSEGF